MIRNFIVLYYFFMISYLFSYKIEHEKLYVDVLIQKSNRIQISTHNNIIISDNLQHSNQLSGSVTFSLNREKKYKKWIVESDYLDINSDFVVINKILGFQKKELQYKKLFQYEFLSKEEQTKFINKHNFDFAYETSHEGGEVFINGKLFTLPLLLRGQKVIKLDKELVFDNDLILDVEDGQLILIANIELEEYIKGVIAGEMVNNAPLEALKTQAVISRTKAIYSILTSKNNYKKYDFDATTSHQVFSPKLTYKNNINVAVYDTDKEVITYYGQLIDAVFSSNCGGRTESNSNIWVGKQLPYLKSRWDGKERSLNLSKDKDVKKWITSGWKINCAPTLDSKDWERNAFQWEVKISKAELEKKLHLKNIESIKILKRGDSGRILKIKISDTKGHIKILENQSKIRHIFGNLKSSLFIIIDEGHYLHLKGKGSGHGVGLCQFGAINLAKKGNLYKSIIKYYYKDVQITSFTLMKNK